MSVVCRWVK
ncbi:hypothetical protein ACOMHN_058771 [Nucella lapillus]